MGLVGYFKPQEGREASFSNLICLHILLLNHFYISKCFLSFTHSFPFYPSPTRQTQQGFLFLLFFWLNKLKPSEGVGLPSPSQPWQDEAFPLCVSGRVGRGASFCDEIPQRMVESQLGINKAVCWLDSTQEQHDQSMLSQMPLHFWEAIVF